MDKLKEHWESDVIRDWHRSQFENPKRNLIHFENFISLWQDLNGQYLLDLACGGGRGCIFL